MKLLLTLLAILTGFAGGDAVRHASAPTAALGAVALLAEAAVAPGERRAAHRPLTEQPRHIVQSCLQMARALVPAPIVPGFAPRGLRTRE